MEKIKLSLNGYLSTSLFEEISNFSVNFPLNYQMNVKFTPNSNKEGQGLLELTLKDGDEEIEIESNVYLINESNHFLNYNVKNKKNNDVYKKNNLYIADYNTSIKKVSKQDVSFLLMKIIESIISNMDLSKNLISYLSILMNTIVFIAETKKDYYNQIEYNEIYYIEDDLNKEKLNFIHAYYKEGNTLFMHGIIPTNKVFDSPDSFDNIYNTDNFFIEKDANLNDFFEKKEFIVNDFYQNTEKYLKYTNYVDFLEKGYLSYL